jgi:SAM-dependent methyltransferase
MDTRESPKRQRCDDESTCAKWTSELTFPSVDTTTTTTELDRHVINHVQPIKFLQKMFDIKWEWEEFKGRGTPMRVVALGSGGAVLAEQLSGSVKVDVISSDLRTIGEKESESTKVPLAGGSMDIVILCRSLNSASGHEYINEAHRILKPRGALLVVIPYYKFSNDPQQVARFYDSIVLRGFLGQTEDRYGVKTEVDKDYDDTDVYFYFFKSRKDKEEHLRQLIFSQ